MPWSFCFSTADNLLNVRFYKRHWIIPDVSRLPLAPSISFAGPPHHGLLQQRERREARPWCRCFLEGDRYRRRSARWGRLCPAGCRRRGANPVRELASTLTSGIFSSQPSIRRKIDMHILPLMCGTCGHVCFLTFVLDN